MSRDEILESLSRHYPELRRCFGVTSLALFGSVAREEAGAQSDIDILVEFRGTPSLREYMDLKFWLEKHLGRQVDLVMKSALQPWAFPIVEAESILVA